MKSPPRRNRLTLLAAIALINMALIALTLQPLSLSALMTPFGKKAQPTVRKRVIQISVDGLGSYWFRPLLSALPLPNFKRLMREGAWTLNARADFDWTVTLPNHAGMLTGRPVYDKYGLPQTGHQWTNNGGFPPNTTLHSNAGYYVASAFDVAHDNGLRTGLYASKDKFYLYRDSYDAAHGAADITGTDNGNAKLDVYVNYDLNSTFMMSDFVANMSTAPTDYTFVHFNDADTAGHRYNWGSTEYISAVVKVDNMLGEIFHVISTSAVLNDNTSIVLTADHGGTGLNHGTQTDPLNYTIPLLVWGPGMPQDTDLYALNPTTALDPANTRVDFEANNTQPLRNSDTGNCAMRLLGLGTIPGSSVANLLAPCATTPATLQAVRSGVTWRYSYPTAAPDAGWRAPAFDDAAWASGMSPLGYGDPVSTTFVIPATCPYAPAAFFAVSSACRAPDRLKPRHSQCAVTTAWQFI